MGKEKKEKSQQVQQEDDVYNVEMKIEILCMSNENGQKLFDKKGIQLKATKQVRE